VSKLTGSGSRFVEADTECSTLWTHLFAEVIMLLIRFPAQKIYVKLHALLTAPLVFETDHL